jgi:hypothetical protein
MKWTEILTALVALYGAVVATFTAITQYRNSRPRLKVELKEGWIIGDPNVGDDKCLTVSTKNFGQKKVTLNILSFKSSNGKAWIVPAPGVTFPYELEPECCCVMYMKAKSAAQALGEGDCAGKIILTATVADAIGREYRSNAFEFDADHWGSIPANKGGNV